MGHDQGRGKKESAGALRRTRRSTCSSLGSIFFASSTRPQPRTNLSCPNLPSCSRASFCDHVALSSVPPAAPSNCGAAPLFHPFFFSSSSFSAASLLTSSSSTAVLTLLASSADERSVTLSLASVAVEISPLPCTRASREEGAPPPAEMVAEADAPPDEPPPEAAAPMTRRRRKTVPALIPRRPPAARYPGTPFSKCGVWNLPRHWA